MNCPVCKVKLEFPVPDLEKFIMTALIAILPCCLKLGNVKF